MRSSLKGVFACEDCLEKGLYQVVTACAEGAEACSNVQRYLL